MIKPIGASHSFNRPARSVGARRPLARVIAAVLAMGAAQAHAGNPVLSQGWLAQQASQRGTQSAVAPPSAMPGNLAAQTPGQLLQQQVLQHSLANLNLAAQAVAAQISAQQAAQQAAQQLSSPVPDGLTKGGLAVAAAAASNPSLWQNANAPTQSTANGHVTVQVKQTAQKAILTWDSFNVGRNTTLYFNQSGGNQTNGKNNNWIALNRIVDPSDNPSQIFGQIKAEGTVYLLNRNGILFGSGSQVNTQSLIASSLDLFSSNVGTSNNQFLTGGIGAGPSTNTPFLVNGVFTDGKKHDVVVQNGASITGGTQGFVLLAAPNVSNAGSIVDDQGQVILAAAAQLNNLNSTAALPLSVVNALEPGVDPNYAGGTATNTGLLQSRRGEVEMDGYNVNQNGVALASTSISYPGSIVLNAQDQYDNGYLRSGTLTLGPHSVTTVLPEEDGATTTSTAAATAAFTRSSVSLSGNLIDFQSGSLLEAPNANLTINAKYDTPNGYIDPLGGRVYIDNGAVIDVSGLANVQLPISALLVTIPLVGQNELANSPLLRNSFLYHAADVTVDSSQSGVTANGLSWVGSPVLNAAGYVDDIPRMLDQLMTNGGTINLSGSQVIVRNGASVNLNGGYVAYQPGWITTPNLLASNGQIYNIANADPNQTYVGFAGQYSVVDNRWGVSTNYSNPLLAGATRYDSGFAQGGNAGTLNINTGYALALDGQVNAQAFAGRNQVVQGSQPSGGTLDISVVNGFNTTGQNLGLNILLQQSVAPLEQTDPGFQVNTPWSTVLGNDDPTGTNPYDLSRWVPVSANLVQQGGFSNVGLSSTLDFLSNPGSVAPVYTGGEILQRAGSVLSVQPGGSVQLTANAINIQGEISAPAGSITLTGSGEGYHFDPSSLTGAMVPGDIIIGSGAVLSTKGLWVNDSGVTAGNYIGDRYINGGTISLIQDQSLLSGFQISGDQTGSIVLQSGSLLDASSGGYVNANGLLQLTNGVPDGSGGSISLIDYANQGVNKFSGSTSSLPAALGQGKLVLDGSLRAYGFSGGGTLSLQAVDVQIGGSASDLALSNGLYLSPTFFAGQGFDNYAIASFTDAHIAPGTMLQVSRDNLLPNVDALLAAPTGTDIYGNGFTTGSAYVDVGQLAPYLRYVSRNANGPGFSLSAGLYLGYPTISVGVPQIYPGVSGALTMGAGAVIAADAGAKVTLAGTESSIVDGTIDAPGGSITITTPLVANDPNVPQVWLGSDAVLNAAGVSLINPLAAAVPGGNQGTGLATRFVPRTGVVLDGGNVSLTSAQGYVATEQGSLIDVSGASDVYDLPVANPALSGSQTGYTPTSVWSDAGSILLGGASLYADGNLSAQPGSSLAEGGSLQIVGMSPNVSQTVFHNKPVVSGIVVQQSGLLLPGSGLQQGGETAGSARDGVLHFALDRLDGSGISSLILGPDASVAAATNTSNSYALVPIGFAGGIDLSLGKSLQAFGLSFTSLSAGSRDFSGLNTAAYNSGNGTVQISAPYVELTGNLGSTTADNSAVAGDGSLDIHADFMDLGGQINLQGWANSNFSSSGAVRFYEPIDLAYVGAKVFPGFLFSTGNITFKAAELYPATNYAFAIDANPSGLTDAQGQPLSTTLTILGNGPASAPLSAGGSLLLDADNIVQNGTVWTPAGNLVIGVQDPAAAQASFGFVTNGQTLVVTKSVTLGAGSLSSVSLDGETVPYGSTTDGQNWNYAGAPGVPVSPLTAPPSKSITIAGNDVSLDNGATIDIRGGGSLQASEWVPGTGGSVNVLTQYETSYANSTSGVQIPQYTDARPIYAIVPGYNAPVGAQDAAMANTVGAGAGPAVGQSVYLSGIAGLPAGYYTLLPASYATLPGAYRLVQNTGSQNVALGQNGVLPDGTLSVSGYFANALDGTHQSTNTTFLVQSAPVWQQYSQYNFTSADTYFTAQASKAGTIAPQLPADGGHLVLSATEQLQLGATLDNAPASTGRAGMVDIAGQAIQVVGADSTPLAGYLQISADQLTGLDAGSLLLGGTRQLTSNGYQVTSIADSVVLSNSSADPLQGSEILLVANGNGNPGAQGIVLQSGSYLAATGAATPNTTPLLFGSNAGTSSSGGSIAAVSGDGALLRVSQDGAVPVTRNDVSASGQGNLTIDAGATVQGGSSLTMDTTGNTSVDPNAVFAARNIQATANQISFVGSDTPAVTSGLVIGPNTLNLFDGASQVTLSSRGDMDFLGDVNIDLPQSLNLNAEAFVSDGGKVDITSGTLGLGNVLGSGKAVAAAGVGQLTLNANELDFTAGRGVTQGFASVTANAGQGMAGQGKGGLDFGAADVSLNTPILLAESGANTTLTTTGDFAVNSASGKALTDNNMGGALTLSGGTLSVGTHVDALAGKLGLAATSGDLSLGSGANLDAAGVNKSFYDVTTYAAGGELALSANKGSVLVDSGAVLNFSGAPLGGTAGSLSIAAGNLVALNGSFEGGAVSGYKGGYFSLSSGGALDLDQLAQLTHDAGTTGGISIASGAGNLLLSAGQSLVAQDVYLTANGGSGAVNANNGVVDIEGTVNVSGNAAGQIQLYGRNGVTVNGSLLATSSVPGQFGGIVDIGTLGTPDSGSNNLNSTYGYENVQPGNAGSIVFGPNAIVNVAGGSAGVGGIVDLRAPLLANGDVPITFANNATITGANKVSIVPYAMWSTDDTEFQGTSKYFDGLIDPAGWYANAGAGSTPQLVAGIWYNAAATALPAPTTAAMLQTYLSNDYFVPDQANAAHQDFYGYVGGNAGAPGTLMGYVEQPGYSFGNRYAGIANLQVSPGVELINPDAGINGGAISVLTNWNLGAGVTAADGTIQLAYRYAANPAVSASGIAPTLTLLALHNVNVDASITDGFYQQNNGATLTPPVSKPSGGAEDPLYASDYDLYQQAIKFLQTGNSEYVNGYTLPDGTYYLWNGGYAYFYDPTDSFLNTYTSSFIDSTNSQFYQPVTAPLTAQSTAYYQNYATYINDVGAGQPGTWSYAYNNADYSGMLAYNPSTVAAPQVASYANYAAYAQAYQTWLTTNFQNNVPLPQMQTPQPLLSPLQLEASSNYTQYSSDYANYIAGFNSYYNYVASTLTNGTSSVLFYAPFTPYGGATQIPQAANNSPSNMPSLGNPASLASATLLGGSSSSYQLVAGANFGSANPLSTVANTGAGNVNLNGDFAVQYTGSGGNGATLEFPTVVRTGTGSIDIVAAGDIDWQDTNAPAAIYTAGAPAVGTTAGTGVTPVVPSGDGVVPDWLVNGQVNPDGAGNIVLNAGGDIHGIEQVYDTTGNMTGTAGTFIGQFWWPWMETGNSATSSSINFANFDQGVMSAGGNVEVNAGGNISDLSVSLPTTWYANAAGTAITTVGGGNLSVNAGGDILSGSYFVSKGTGSLMAGGSIASDFSYVLPIGSSGPGGISLSGIATPVSTLLALQNAQWSVQARDGVDIADILNPSYASPETLSADEQSYSATSAVKATTAAGDLTLGSLAWETQVLGDSASSTDLGVLPSTLDFTALNGNINVLTAGGLYPSATGNLSLLASDSIQFSQQNYDIEGTSYGTPHSFGLIDADASVLPSPLNPLGSNLSSSYNNLSAQSYLDQGVANAYSSYLHQAGLHDGDTNPVRIYALNGDVIDGTPAPNGLQMDQVLIEPDKPALIYAGGDIVNLSFLGQQTHASDITRIAAGGSIYDTLYTGSNPLQLFPPLNLNYQLVPVIAMGGVGTLDVEAGHNMGPFTNQTDLLNANNGQVNVPTGIQSVGNTYNPYLPHDGASIDVLFGVGPGIDTSNFLKQYLSNPDAANGFGSLLPDLVSFMEQREDGYAVNTGYAQDQLHVTLTTAQAEAAFQQLPAYVQQQFVQQEFFKLLAQVDTDYNDPGSLFYHQYARGYAAIDSLFPASLGYTNNGSGAGGLNGEAQTVPTGDLDIRSSTIQTQQGGDISILGPGGQALIGSVDAPPVITNSQGKVLAGPNDIGVLTLEQGNVNIFTDRSLLLAQSRIFTEQGGNMVIWSSNGDINAGQGAKTVAVIPPPTYLCDLDAFCLIDARGEVSGAGIATLQTIAGAPPGNVYLVAPRGTVDAGDAGIRVSGNVVLAAAQVLNAANIQVQGSKIGVPVAQAVNIGALNAAGAAAGAVTKVAQDMVNQQKNDALSKMPSIISVQVLGFGGDNSSSIMGSGSGYDPNSPVKVLGAGHLSELSKQSLTQGERQRLVE